MRDPYSTLDVSRDASLDDIKRAFRRLAKALHPDLHPDDDACAGRFKDITAAYEVLCDEAKRRRVDRDHAVTEPAPRRRSEGRRAAGGTSGGDVCHQLVIGFVEAAIGMRKAMVLADGRSVVVEVPPGTLTGQVLRLAREGRAGRPAGDLLVEIVVERHPALTRRDRDIHLTLPVTVPEAMQGAMITVPTVHGPMPLRIPSNSSTGRVLRLKGKGIPQPDGSTGDQCVTLKVVLPPGEETEFSKIVEQWGRRRSYVVR